jgi:hypothetical protein
MEDTMKVGIRDWFLDIARGGQPGASHERVFGKNPDVDTGTDPEDVWDQGGMYTYTAAGGATHYISSSNNGDTQIVTVKLLSEDASGDWNEEELAITLVGQTKTAIVTTSGDDPVRILSANNESGTALLGDVYIYEDDTVVTGVPQTPAKIRAKIILGNERTNMALYTIPSGKTGYMYTREFGVVIPSGSTVVGRFFYRREGRLFVMDQEMLLISGIVTRYTDWIEVPLSIPAKTDMKATAFSVSVDNTAVVAAFDLILLG